MRYVKGRTRNTNTRGASSKTVSNTVLIVVVLVALGGWMRRRSFASVVESEFGNTIKVDRVLEFEGPGGDTNSLESDGWGENVRSRIRNEIEGNQDDGNGKVRTNGETIDKEQRDEVNADNVQREEESVDNGEKDVMKINRLEREEKEDTTNKLEELQRDQVDKVDKTNKEDKEQQQQNQQQQQQANTNERQSISDYLNFTPKTAINFMHFHKTGGVSFKTAVHKFYYEKTKQVSNEPVLVRDACYERTDASVDSSAPSFRVWRCDWQPIRDQDEKGRNQHDFVIGHQFRKNGVDGLLNQRDLRTFTVMRHPFDRKVSFFYHFFVRERGRKEADISFEEIKDFLLFDQLRIDADLGRDLGPNYMAGRLLSDGIEGFKGNASYSHFIVEDYKQDEIVSKAKNIIKEYVFVGLQNQAIASQCMLRKVMEEWNRVNQVDKEGIEEVDQESRMNSGAYGMKAKDIWARMSERERQIFNKKERVDLDIYEEGERLFNQHVKLFGCSNRLQPST